MKDMKQGTGTEKKEDRRVRRTKKLLSQGLIELMQQKQVKDITVRELADLVDVNRGTFYLYSVISSTCWNVWRKNFLNS